VKTVVGFLSLCFILIAAGPVQAQNLDSYAQLRKVASARYSVTDKREGDSAWLDWVASYNPPGTQEFYDWRLQANIVRKPGQSDIVRLWFNCGEMPAKPNAERMLKMLEWNGSHASSAAYFKSGPGSNGVQLSIIVDVPLNDVVPGKFEKAVEHMLAFAYETKAIWGAPGDPLSTNTRKHVTLEAISGHWSGVATKHETEHSQWSEEVGQWSAKIEADGFIVVSRVDTREVNRKVKVSTGTAWIEDDNLIIKFIDGTKREEHYQLTLTENALTLTDQVSKSTTLKVALIKQS
jgi:hypothetical protein